MIFRSSSRRLLPSKNSWFKGWLGGGREVKSSSCFIGSWHYNGWQLREDSGHDCQLSDPFPFRRCARSLNTLIISFQHSNLFSSFWYLFTVFFFFSFSFSASFNLKLFYLKWGGREEGRRRRRRRREKSLFNLFLVLFWRGGKRV